jgi:predicted transcriptional regulator
MINVGRTMDMEEIRTAFRKADDGYVDDEDTFVITEKGKAWLDEQLKQRKSSSLS